MIDANIFLRLKTLYIVLCKMLNPTYGVIGEARENSANGGHVGKWRAGILRRSGPLSAPVSFLGKNDKFAIVSISHTLGPDHLVLF